MSSASQFPALLGLSVSGLAERLGTALTVTIGVTCAVGVLVSMLSMGTGAKREALSNVRDDRVVLTSLGARGVESSIPREEAARITGLPGIQKGSDGAPIVVFQATVPIEAEKRGTDKRIFFPLTGVGGAPLREFAPELRLTNGRMFRTGLQELIASNPCIRQFDGFELGQKRSIQGLDWTIVGIFDLGREQQCVLFTDVDQLMSSFKINSYNEAVAMLQSTRSYGELLGAVDRDPTLHLELHHEREAQEEGIKQLDALLNFAAYFVGAVMAAGATLGAVNSLYTIVDSRRREIATLRAIGFSSGAVGTAVLCESIVLAIPGAFLGVMLAWLLFHRMAVSPFGFAFQLDVTPALAAIGFGWALALGFLGGLLPASRAARMPVASALRST
jgi:putative ABC transport system permease protein